MSEWSSVAAKALEKAGEALRDMTELKVTAQHLVTQIKDLRDDLRARAADSERRMIEQQGSSERRIHDEIVRLRTEYKAEIDRLNARLLVAEEKVSKVDAKVGGVFAEAVTALIPRHVPDAAAALNGTVKKLPEGA